MSLRKLYLLPFTFYLVASVACVPSAAPVSVGSKPVSGFPPSKNIEEMGWTKFDSMTEKLKDYRGKVVVLDFWATYCPPCIEEIPHLASLKSQNKDLEIIGLHVGGEEDRPKIPQFTEKLKINYPLAYPDRELSATLLGDDSRIPQTVIFDKNGKMLTKIVGFDAQAKKTLDETIAQALK
jgi:thiol-disulfide isomerase/thioredoxin